MKSSGFLKCQNLIHRVYRRAYDLEFLKDECYDIMVAFFAGGFKRTSDLTRKIKETMCEKMEHPQFDAFFEYVNEQMLEQGLGDFDQDTELNSQAQKKQNKEIVHNNEPC